MGFLKNYSITKWPTFASIDASVDTSVVLLSTVIELSLGWLFLGLILRWLLPNCCDFTSSAAAFYMFGFGLSFFSTHSMWTPNQHVVVQRAASFILLEILVNILQNK